MVLPDALAGELRLAARRLDVPVAEFIRDAMQQKLQEMNRPASGDPFQNTTAIVASTEEDLAARVDEVLYR